MSKPPRKRDEVEFFGGPRDGDRIVVKGTPATFSIPEQVKAGKRTASVNSTYRFEGGAYHYVGQTGFWGEDD